MTKREALIVSAYTGYFMCNMSELHKFIEETLGRAIDIHELADDETLNELRDKVRDEFIKIAINACDKSNAEVAEVKHGKWEVRTVRGEAELYCSVCGNSPGILYQYRFCPHCGAKMDLEVE